MTQAELLSHITHLAPPEAPGARDSGSATYVNQSRLRRKQQRQIGS